jgi:hypothetical protein
MTGEQLVGTSTKELEAMSDEQLLAWVTPILQYTRPKEENIIKEVPKPPKEPKVKKEKKVKVKKEDKDQLLLDTLAEQIALLTQNEASKKSEELKDQLIKISKEQHEN